MKKYLLLFLVIIPLISHAQVCGSDKDLQWNNSGGCGASSTLQWDNSKTRLQIINEGLWPAFYASSSGTGVQVEGTQTLGGAINIFGVANPFNASTEGLQIAPNFSPTNSNKSYYGALISPLLVGNQSISSVTGVLSTPFTKSVPSPSYTGTTTNVISYDIQPYWTTGTALNWYGFKVSSSTFSGGTIGNVFGLSIADISGGTSTNYAIKTGLGAVSFGDKTFVKGFNNSVSYSPASTTPCTVGDQTWDKAYAYFCVGSNSWRRAILSTY